MSAGSKTYEFFAKQKHSKLKNVQGCTFLSGVFRGRAPKQRATFMSWEKFLNFLGKITKGICTR